VGVGVSATASPGRPRLLLGHDEAEIIDLLRGLFDAHGFAVEECRTLAGATARIDDVGVVVVACDRPLGQEIYRAAIARDRDLRRRFLFVADRIPAELTRAAERGRVVLLGDLPTLVASASAIAAQPDRRPPRLRLLLVEDDPEQRDPMADLLGALGFDVTAVAGGRAAIARLAEADFDVVLSDWTMADGDGAELHAWAAAQRPELVARLVFMTGGDIREVAARVGAEVIPKGQDSPELCRRLRDVAGAARLAAGTPPRGVELKPTR
jgi:CheY-like chemotaxis protein